MPTSHGTAQKEQHRIESDGRALLRPYATKRSEEGKENKNSLLKLLCRVIFALWHGMQMRDHERTFVHVGTNVLLAKLL